MTIPEAILITLEELKFPANSTEVCDHIMVKRLYDFQGKTPTSTISAQLGAFIRAGDARIKRIKKTGGMYYYYLTKNESSINVDLFPDDEVPINISSKLSKWKTYEERDLHLLLSSYLKTDGIYSKTIFHEQSNGKDSNQIWTHPDMVGIKFLNLQSKASQNFLKSISRAETFKLSSYEIKKEINTDSELKRAFFQAVSNSSWANFGYLVAFEFSANLHEEMARLNQSFGIGIIELEANTYLSRILFQPKYRELDFKTLDKLCKINTEFEKFIEHIQNLMTAEERYYKASEKELEGFCDGYFLNDSAMEKYCQDKNIPKYEISDL